MKFSSMLLYVDDEFPSEKTFEQLLYKGTKQYRKGNNLYSIDQTFDNDNSYWMYFQYDNEFLYTDKVVDTVDNSEKDNPRPKSQVEMRYQLFACYDFNRKLLYVSDYSKKSTITDYISDMLQVSTNVKNVLTSIEEFTSIYKCLKSVSFFQRRSIFTLSDDSIFKKQANLFGLDLPEHSKLKVDYGNSPVGIVRTVLQDWKQKHDSGEFEDIVLIGVDDSGFESTFNFSTMVASIEIELQKDENFRYNPQMVKALLLAKLGEYCGKK